MTIQSDIQKLHAGGIVRLFSLDTTPCGGLEVLNFHGHKEGPITWQGTIYMPWPMEITGLEVSSKGTLPRPSMKVSNQSGVLKGLVREYDDLLGAKVTIRRTFTKYLDNGSEPDESMEFPLDVFFVEKKTSDNDIQLEFELVSALDLNKTQLPRRVITTSYCNHDEYRGPECSYTGTNYFDTGDNPTTADKDVCGRKLGSCKLRFGATAELPFAGFPGARLYRL